MALVKPDVARMVGDRLIQLAQMGQIKSKVEEETIIQLLEQVQQQATKTTIKVRRDLLQIDSRSSFSFFTHIVLFAFQFQRRRTDDDDDDDM